MKKIKLLFAVCLIPLALHAAVADEVGDIARSAKRTSSATNAVSSRQKSDISQLSGASIQSRQTAASPKTTDASSRDRATSPRDGQVISVDTSRTAASSQSVAARTASAPRATSNIIVSPRISDRNIRTPSMPTTTSARSAARTTSASRSVATASRTLGTARPSTGTSARSVSVSPARVAVATSEVQTSGAKKDYKKCREVYYSCMDEFCANKDSQLKRCACSARINDFDGAKKNLSSIEDKMLDFNQRLLTVNMDKEDAEAITGATEGELAYQQDDKSASKKILDEISKKLKSSSADKDFTRNLSAISLSLDMDAAFDNIDSMMGASTTTKEGPALYNAALPICREMAAEVCDEDGASIAESGYQMAIEQDCNTVSKAYETKQGQALEKIREGGALLEMSRLDIHQKRNADDILTCKKKMLDMLANSSVCGKDLGKCLDTTGRYIDPSTGEAFLTVNLVDLGSLITRPSGNQKWTSATGNDKFVSFLNSKKKYLEPAMEGCQDISERVWLDFVEDALAQIKLAQEQKLEDMRQSCTSLTTQCLSNTAKSISEFDARALSIFGVSADKTVNEMCSNIKTACTALLESTSGDADWVGGMTEIATNKTYETLIQTCREVGKACIIQACKSVSGNFGLCENIDLSVNRKSIINRTACWNDVVKCIDDAGKEPIDRIMEQLKKVPSSGAGDFYPENYAQMSGNIIRTNKSTCRPVVYDDEGNSTAQDNCIYDICAECDTAGQPSCATCRLAEKIWGNCEFAPNQLLTDPKSQNMIKITTGTKFDTLLSWFAVNTGTSNNRASCKDTSCGIGMTQTTNKDTGEITCTPTSSISSDGQQCVQDKQFTISEIPNKWTNCCDPKHKDAFNNCCPAKKDIAGINLNANGNYYSTDRTAGEVGICIPSDNSEPKFVAGFKTGTDMNYLLCIGDLSYEDTDAIGFPGGQKVKCSGEYIIVNRESGTYNSPVPASTDIKHDLYYPQNSYNIANETACIFDSNTSTWKGLDASGKLTDNPNCDKIDGRPNNTTDYNLMIKYDKLTSD